MKDREAYRRAAAECLDIANNTADQNARTRLVLLGAKFLDMAREPEPDTETLDRFNEQRMRK